MSYSSSDFNGIAKAVESFEFDNKEITTVVISFKRATTGQLVHVHYDGEKFVDSDKATRLEFLGMSPTANATEICLNMGICAYQIEGHCDEQAMLRQYGENCNKKYFIAWDLDSCVETASRGLLTEDSALYRLYDSEQQAYEAVATELATLKLI